MYIPLKTLTLHLSPQSATVELRHSIFCIIIEELLILHMYMLHKCMVVVLTKH